MAFAITNTNTNQDPNLVGVPSATFQLADQTTSTGFQDLPFPCKTFRAFVFVKSGSWGSWTAVAGSATFGLSFELQAADDTNTYSVDVKTLNASTIGGEGGFGGYMIELFGTYPLATGANSMQVEVFNPNSETIAFDVEMTAC